LSRVTGDLYTAIVTSLADRIGRTSTSAALSGALVSIPTTTTVIEDSGIPFIVHVTALQRTKRRATRAAAEPPTNPFLPPDPKLSVGAVEPRHHAVLNKYNVLERHLLIVTRAFEPQRALLDEGDLEALARCMAEVDGLGFYNAGAVAGASQEHKHLQLVPLPLGSGPPATPLDLAIDPALSPGRPSRVHPLPFEHVLIPFDGRPLTPDRAPSLAGAYDEARRAVGIVDDSRPYNLLVTRRWMLLVPRRREHWRNVSVNALGFAGSLLVGDLADLEALRRTGPLNVLRSVVEASP
jgi:ATP adenylyltransferase